MSENKELKEEFEQLVKENTAAEEAEHTASEAPEQESAQAEEAASAADGAGAGEAQTSGEETEADAEGTADAKADGKEAKGSKLFSKKAKAEKKDKTKEKIEELEDRVKRQMAEFDNFRKRTEKEKSQMFEMGAKSVIEKILPVVDNFERGLSSAQEGDAFAEGMSMVYKQLMTELDAIGVKAIEAVGTEFDPDFHNAVMQVESEEYDSGIVAQELQKGYMYHDTVVRHSMVAVVQ